MPLVVQQTSLAQRHKNELQEYADREAMLYQDLWVKAINDFLETRETMLKRGVRMSYLASATDSVAWNMKLPKTLVKKVKRVANTDFASARRLYYTALMQFIAQYIH